MSDAGIAEAPPPDCPLCPRLAAFRAANRAAFPTFFNAPVPSFGDPAGRLLVIGLAPGLKGANRTGRPFTGDHAGGLLYETLLRFGFAEGVYRAAPDDGLTLIDCRIVNAVRCVPPENRPTPAEIATCRRFLEAELRVMDSVRVIVALGAIAHRAVLDSFGVAARGAPFAHAAEYKLASGITLLDSYHCSRQNTNTGRLTRPMFEAIFAAARRHLDTPPG